MVPDNNSVPKPSGWSQAQRVVGILTALITTAVAVGGFYLAFSSRGGQSPSSTATVTPTSAPPTSVMLSASAQGMAPTTAPNLVVHSGTIVTLTVIPDHSLLPFQTYSMGIYAQDPYGFSELQYCTYPHTDTCSYVLSYSSSENTDYSKGTHIFTGFLGDIGGSILQHSNNIIITWSQ
jgi:hypothetical protein